MKKYVYEEYADRYGTGDEKIFDKKEDAVSYAKEEWDKLTYSEKKTYKKDTCESFKVYEIELSQEQLDEYNDGELEIALSELWIADIFDALA